MSRLLRAEMVLPLTIVAAAIMLGVSEFMTTFVLTSGPDPQEALTAADRHHFALLILAVFAILATAYAIATGLRAAAIAAAAFGLVALLLFLLIDLPDAGKAGPLGDDPAIYFADARSDPQAGFWLEAIGSVVLGLATVGFATLTGEQLRAPAALFGGSKSRRAGAAASTAAEPDTARSARGGAGGQGSERSPAVAARSTATASRAKEAEERSPSRRRTATAKQSERKGGSAKRSLSDWLRHPRGNDS